MLKINITLKSFELHYIQKNISFLKQVYLLLNKKSKTDAGYDNCILVKKNTPPSESVKISFQDSIPETVGYSQAFLKKDFFGDFKEISYPKTRKLFTVLRGPHVDKKSREQFHFTTHTKKVGIQFKNIKHAVTFLYILKNAELYGVETQIAFYYSSIFSHISS